MEPTTSRQTVPADRADFVAREMGLRPFRDWNIVIDPAPTGAMFTFTPPATARSICLHGCLASTRVLRSARECQTPCQPCSFRVNLDVTGDGSAVALCTQHGSRPLSWEATTELAQELVRCGLLQDSVLFHLVTSYQEPMEPLADEAGRDFHLQQWLHAL